MTGTRTRMFSLLATVALAVTLAGCGDDTPTGPDFQNPSTIRIVNELQGPVLFVSFRTCDTTEWGDDQLAIRARRLGKDPNDPLESVIQPTDAKDFTVEAGCYDLRADHLETTDPGPLLIKMIEDVVVSPTASFNWPLTAAPAGPM